MASSPPPSSSRGVVPSFPLPSSLASSHPPFRSSVSVVSSFHSSNSRYGYHGTQGKVLLVENLEPFSMVCWHLRTARCRSLFEGYTAPPKEIIHRCYNLLMECVINSKFRHQIFHGVERLEERWTPPASDTVRVDVDGSVWTQDQGAARGGVIRDDKGDWIMGFQKDLGCDQP